MNLIQDNSILSTYNESSNFHDISDNKKKGKTKNRPTKNEFYKEEREQFIKELNQILGLTLENKYVVKNDLENNIDFKLFIENNIDKIRKMWKTGLWGYFSNDIKKGSGNLLGLYRTILNDSDYLIFSKQKTISINGSKERRTVYFIDKK